MNKRPCFSRNQNFLKESDKGSPNEYLFEILLQTSKQFLRFIHIPHIDKSHAHKIHVSQGIKVS